MSQASIPSSPRAIKNPPGGAAAPPSKPVLTLAEMVSRAAKDLKRVELAKTLLGLSIIVCLLGLSLILVDHWVWPLPTLFRWMVLLLTCCISVFWVLRQLIPMLGRSINPIFAARQIETKVPELKDSLVSYMQLNVGEHHTPKGVVTAVGRFAVERLSRHDVSEFVSSSTPLRLGMWLFAILILSAIYFIVSPKSGLDSLLRLAMPWHTIGAPTRVKILKISPQDVVIARGQSVEVEVEVQGLLQQDLIQIEFSSLDGQFVDRIIEMRAEVDGLVYRGSLTMGERGILQELEYRVRAGDVVAGPFQVSLEQVPVVSIERMEFEYPRYTRLASSKSDSPSSFTALEGTKVRIYGKSNQEMKSGLIEVAERSVGEQPNENRSSFSMAAQKEGLQGQFQLQLNKKGESPSAFTYRISGVSRLGQSTQEPVPHEYQVTKDESPIINWGVEYPESLELPVNQVTDFVVTASDPDFGLSQVKTVLVRGRSKLDEKILLQNEEGIRQPVTRTWRFEPAKMGLRPGDELTLEAHAFDNRRDIHDSRWQPNSTSSRIVKLKIVAEQKKPTEFSTPEQQAKPLPEQPVDGSDVQKPEQRDQQKSDGTAGNKDKEAEKDDKSEANDPTQAGNDADSKEGDTQQSNQDNTAKDGQESGDATEGDKSSSDAEGQNVKQNDSGETDKSGDKNASESDKRSSEKQGGQSDQSQGHEAQASKDPSGSSAAGSKSDQPNKDDKSAQEQGGGADPSEGGSEGQNGQSQSGGGQQSNGGASGGQSSGGKSASSEQSGSGGSQQGKSDSSSGNSSNKGAKGNSDTGQQGGSSSSGQEGPSKDGGGGENAASGSQEKGPSEGASNKQSGSGSKGGSKSDKPSSGDSSGSSSGNESGSDSSDSSGSQGGGSSSGASSSQQGAPSSSKGNGEKGRLENVERGSRNPDTPMHDGEAFEEINEWMKEHGDPKAIPENEKHTPNQNEQSPSNDIKNQPSKQSTTSGQKDSDSKTNSAKQGSSKDNPGDQPAQNTDSKNDTNSEPDNQKQGGNPTNSQQKQPGSGAGKNGKQDQQSQANANNQANAQNNPGSTSAQSGEKGGSSANSESAPGQSSNPSQPGKGNSTEAPSGVGDASSAPSGAPSGNGSGHTSGAPTKANVDYAKKVTDLALDYLDRQKDQPDPELLKRLGWTDEQLKAFLERWKKAREKGITPEGTKEDYTNDLRSLGIKPPAQGKRSSRGVDDKLSGLSEEGGRSKPPSTLQGPYDAFRKAAQQKASKQ